MSYYNSAPSPFFHTWPLVYLTTHPPPFYHLLYLPFCCSTIHQHWVQRNSKRLQQCLVSLPKILVGCKSRETCDIVFLIELKILQLSVVVILPLIACCCWGTVSNSIIHFFFYKFSLDLIYLMSTIMTWRCTFLAREYGKK